MANEDEPRKPPNLEEAMKELENATRGFPTELSAMCATHHELYCEYEIAGFSPRQALYLVAVAISGRPGETPPTN